MVGINLDMENRNKIRYADNLLKADVESKLQDIVNKIGTYSERFGLLSFNVMKHSVWLY